MALSSKERERVASVKVQRFGKVSVRFERKKKKKACDGPRSTVWTKSENGGIFSPTHAQSWLIQCGPFRKTKQKNSSTQNKRRLSFSSSLSCFKKFLHRNVKDEKMAQFLVDVFLMCFRCPCGVKLMLALCAKSLQWSLYFSQATFVLPSFKNKKNKTKNKKWNKSPQK